MYPGCALHTQLSSTEFRYTELSTASTPCAISCNENSRPQDESRSVSTSIASTIPPRFLTCMFPEFQADTLSTHSTRRLVRAWKQPLAKKSPVEARAGLFRARFTAAGREPQTRDHATNQLREGLGNAISMRRRSDGLQNPHFRQTLQMSRLLSLHWCLWWNLPW